MADINDNQGMPQQQPGTVGGAPNSAQGGAPGGTQGGGAPLIKDGDTNSFVQDVLEGSKAVPVIVDFWAPWCEPCKQIGPALERAVTAAQGTIRLVKINVDENQELARQMQVQSIPAVFAFKDGKPVDGFVGAKMDSEIQQFISQIAGDDNNEIEEAVAHARAAQDAGDVTTAGSIYAQIIQADPSNVAALAGMTECLIATGDLAQATQTLALIPPNQSSNPDYLRAKGALELAEKMSEHGDPAALTAAVEADPNDHQSRLDLAVALFGADQREEAIEHLLEILTRKRDWNEDAARVQLLAFFDIMGPADPLTMSSRRRLSSLLFS